VLALATIVSVQMLTAASLERWGRVYGETWALEDALRVQPWRLSSAERLAFIWALDGRAGGRRPNSGARGRRAVAAPWDGDVRLWAAVETLLATSRRACLDRQSVERFPDTSRAGRRIPPLENAVPGA
jgi:hypothetical protein